MKISIILLLGLIFRLLIFPLGRHDDIYSIAGWGQWIGQNGSLGFYENNKWVYSWPTQPPLVNLVYGFCWNFYVFSLELMRSFANTIITYHLVPGKMIWFFNYLLWYDKAINPVIPYPNGFIFCIKLIAIIGDLLITWIIYQLAVSRKTKTPHPYPIIYLFSPFSWYISALWGQYDQTSFLLLLLAFFTLLKYPTVSLLLLSFSIGMKPTTAIFIPFYFWILYRKKVSFSKLIVGGIIALLFTWWTIGQFYRSNPINYIQNTLIPKIVYKSEFRVTNNSYNFWHIFTGDKGRNQNEYFLFLPYKIWALFLFVLINFYAFRLNLKPGKKNIISGLFIIGMGSWLFLTNMLERYYFSGIVSGILLLIYYPRLLKYWLLASLLFWLNLYRGWWFPPWPPLKTFLTSSHLVSGIWLSLVNLLIYLKILFQLSHVSKNKKD